jgi:uncharacterized protein (DUF885 family)
MVSRDNLLPLANDYFESMAACFPVMCASDEFHFLPRAQAAAKYDYRMEQLDRGSIADTITQLQNMRARFEKMDTTGWPLERCIDRDLLIANINGVLIELHHHQSWRFNPLLYLKIAFIGLEQAITAPTADEQQRQDRLHARLKAIPALLDNAQSNLSTIDDDNIRMSQIMLEDALAYLGGLPSLGLALDEFLLHQVQEALLKFRHHLQDIPSRPPAAPSQDLLILTLRRHFRCRREPQEIYAIAEDQWHQTLAYLNDLQKSIDRKRTWQQLYQSFRPDAIQAAGTFDLYSREIKSLQAFFQYKEFDRACIGAPLELAQTPVFLQSVRSSASFAAALGNRASAPSFFYISPTPPPGSSSESRDDLRARLHREYQFLSAHETVPGHHLLDACRRIHPNPIRRQIESPLFYEGWATYAESLLFDYGYLDGPMLRLVDAKRRLWRLARCMIDVGSYGKQLSSTAALALLAQTGFSAEEGQRQIKRFRLNPGYQLCYSLGLYEIQQLKKKFAPLLGPGQFDIFILAGGELPFHRIAQRLAAQTDHSQALSPPAS